LGIRDTWLHKLDIDIDIDKLRHQFVNEVMPLGDPIIQGETYGSKFGGWGVLTGDGDWKNGMVSGQLAFGDDGYDFKAAHDHNIHHEFNYKHKTEICTGYIEKIIDQIDDMGLHPRRARFTVLQSGGESTIHTDALPGKYALRLHIPLITNEDCVHIVYDEDDNVIDEVNLKADGSAYVMWVNNRHQIKNNSDKDRYHLLMSVWDTKPVHGPFHYPQKSINKLKIMAAAHENQLKIVQYRSEKEKNWNDPKTYSYSSSTSAKPAK